MESTSTQEHTQTYGELESYPWDKDAEFQGGLSAILGSNPSPSQAQELTLRAKCFFFSRKKSIPIDFDAYKAYLLSKNASETSITTQKSSQPQSSSNHYSTDLPSSTSIDTQQKTAPYPPTFAEIVEMITSGTPIPGIKEIPPTVLTEQASAPKASRRRKPWEKENAGKENEIGGTFGDRRDEVIKQDLPEV